MFTFTVPLGSVWIITELRRMCERGFELQTLVPLPEHRAVLDKICQLKLTWVFNINI